MVLYLFSGRDLKPAPTATAPARPTGHHKQKPGQVIYIYLRHGTERTTDGNTNGIQTGLLSL